MVCIRASSMELSTPFLLSKARPANVQKRTCLMPTDTKCVSESGRNSATKILWVWPIQLATLAPEGQIRKKWKCDLSVVVWLCNSKNEVTVKRTVFLKIYIYIISSYLPATSRWWWCVQGPSPLTAGVSLWHWSWQNKPHRSGNSVAPTKSAWSWHPKHE